MLDITTTEITNPNSAKIIVIGAGGAGGNAINNMIMERLVGCEFAVCNTDAQALSDSKAEKKFQIGKKITEGLGAGANPDVGRESAEENFEEISNYIDGANMVFISAGMGGGTGTGSAPVIARAAREKGILTVGVVTKPFEFEGTVRMKQANTGIEDLKKYVDTLIVIPNEKLYTEVSDTESISDAFKKVDRVLYLAVQGVTDLMVKPGMINLDFNDVKTVMQNKGKAMMGVGEASKAELNNEAASVAAESAIRNRLLDNDNMKGAKSAIINITSNDKITLNDINVAVNRLRQEIDPDANIIYGHTIDEEIGDTIRVSIVATGIDATYQGVDTPSSFNVEEPNTEALWENSGDIQQTDAVVMDSQPETDGFETVNEQPMEETPSFVDEQVDNEPPVEMESIEDAHSEFESEEEVFDNAPVPTPVENEHSQDMVDPFKEADMANATNMGDFKPAEETPQQPEKKSFFSKLFGGVGSNKSQIEEPVRTEPVVEESTTSSVSTDGSLALEQNSEQEKDMEIPSFLRKQMN